MSECEKHGVQHLPETEDLGVMVCEHGERPDCQACLCGAGDYLTCPGWMAESSMLLNSVLFGARHDP